jgi:hypothetical protein
MSRMLSFLTILSLLLTSTACSAKKPLEPSALKSKNVLSVLKEMSASYEKKDLSAFLSDVSDGFRERETFAKSLTAVFAKYEAIHFNIQYTKMLIMIEEKGQIRAAFNWDAEWLAAGGAMQKNGGRVTFVFDPGNFKLLAIDGKNPFVPVEKQQQ